MDGIVTWPIKAEACPKFFWMKHRQVNPGMESAFESGDTAGSYLDGMGVSFPIWTGCFPCCRNATTIANPLMDELFNPEKWFKTLGDDRTIHSTKDTRQEVLWTNYNPARR